MKENEFNEYIKPEIFSEETFDIDEGGISLMAQCYCRSAYLGSQAPNCYSYINDPATMIV